MIFGMNPYPIPEGGETPVHRRKKRFVYKDLNTDEALFSESETTTLDEYEGAKTVEETEVYQAGCGHFIGFQNPAELKSTCHFCAKTLCYRCGDLRCRSCLEIICTTCAKLVDDALVHCRKCKRKVLAKRALKSGSKGIHDLFSKEY